MAFEETVLGALAGLVGLALVLGAAEVIVWLNAHLLGSR